MKVLVKESVYETLEDFYRTSMQLHPTLDEITVRKKIRRLTQSIRQLGMHPTSHPFARFKQDWISNKYRDFVFEDIHIAYTIAQTESGDEFVYVVDACHSLLYHD